MDSLAQTNPELNKWEWEGWGCITIGMREDTFPFSDRRIRLAMSAAIDRDAITNQIYGGYATLLNMQYPAVWPETIYTPLEELEADTQRSYTYDPEWAMELMEAAGVGDGFAAELITETIPTHVDIASMCVDNWSDIGIDITLRPTDSGTIRGYISALTHPAMMAWEDSSSTPAAAMTSFIEEGFTNILIHRDPYTEATYAAAASAVDPVESNKHWKAVGAYVLNDAGFINLPGENGFAYGWPWIKNYEGEICPKYLCGADAFKYAWVDQVLKEDMGY